MVATQTVDSAACARTWCRALAALNWNFKPFVPMGSRGRPGAGPGVSLGCRRYELPKLLLGAAVKRKGFQPGIGISGPESWEELLKTLRDEIKEVEEGLIPTTPLPESGLRRRRTRDDVFALLPNEVLLRLVCQVRTEDLINLRLASRTVATASRAAALPGAFWASRFAIGFDMAFATPKGPKGNDRGQIQTQDWRELYFLITTALRNTETNVGAWLAKRKYWWDRLTAVAEFHTQWGRVTLAGERFFDLEAEPEGTGNGKLVLDEATCVSARLSRDDGVDRGCKTLCLPLWDIKAVGVSVVNMAGESHISGLRIFSSQKTRSLGLVSQSAETVVDLYAGEKLFGFRLRVDDDAVRALKVLSQTPEGRLRVSPWIGDMTSANSMHEMPLIGKFDHGSALVASFDVSSAFVFAFALNWLKTWELTKNSTFV